MIKSTTYTCDICGKEITDRENVNLHKDNDTFFLRRIVLHQSYLDDASHERRLDLCDKCYYGIATLVK